MSFLLDTNSVSEFAKLRPDPGVTAWMAAAREADLFLSVITLAELRSGVERLPAGRRRSRLEDWLVLELVPRFEDRWLGIDLEVGDLWGKMIARTVAAGRQPDAMDCGLAATALVHGLTLVTRNVAHFQPLGVPTLNPWQQP